MNMPSQPNGFPGLPPGWMIETETYRSANGKEDLRALCFRKEPAESHRALLILHGMGEHGGRYLHVPHFLEASVSTIYCPDEQGHGRSTGGRGDIRDFDDLSDDAALAVRRLNDRLVKQFGKSEIHLLGHSLGGLLALRTAFRYPDLPIKTLVVSAPFLGIRDLPPVKKTAALALAKIWGALPLDTGLDAKKLSRDPAVVEHYRKDPLNHGKMTPRFFQALLKAFSDTLARRSGIRVPLLVLVPTGDEVVDGEKTIRFFQDLEHSDKVMKTYPGFYHEPLNDPQKDQVFKDIAAWLSRHAV